VSVISGLLSGDILRVQEDQQYRMSSADPWATFYSPTTSYLLIGDYTHTTGDTILIGSSTAKTMEMGPFPLSKQRRILARQSGDDLTSLDGSQMRVVRELEVWRGATLVSPGTSSRGYTYAYSITGGEMVASESFTGPALTTVPVPAPSC